MLLFPLYRGIQLKPQAETPWLAEMASSPAHLSDNGSGKSKDDANPPTIAAFSPTASSSSPATRQRSTILVHRKSPLLVATPPTITRALAFSHPFLLPLNQLVGLLTWTSGDPWESFLVVAGFWAIALYGDVVTRYAGPLATVICVILGMYSRRYSPLSSSSWTNEKFKDSKKDQSESNMKHQKSLDEIVETMTTFTSRCNILLEPSMQLTDFLSTQRTATFATTRPALTTLFIRILFITPIWIVLTLPPFYILTTRRVILAVGTLMLSWHSRPARVSRAILWRSKLIRRVVSVSTGLRFGIPAPAVATNKGPPPPLPLRHKSQQDAAKSLVANGHAEPAGVRFTFVVFENQRRWLGLGWTYSLLAYERGPWTDEHLNPSDAKDNFQLPEVDHGTAQWRWVPGSEWQIEGGGKKRASTGDDGWIYYDNKWNDGKRGQDGWGRYTRRRKWYRDAELVEVSQENGLDESTDTLVPPAPHSASLEAPPEYTQVIKDGDTSSSGSSQARKRGFFRRGSRSSAHSSGDYSGSSTLRGDERDTQQLPSHQERDNYWGVGDDAKMGLE